MKKCCICKKNKSREEFYKNKSRKDGLSHDCKICNKNRAIVNGKKEEVKLRKKNWDLKTNYGINLDIFNKMRKSQKDRCKICKHEFTEQREINVDHCHVTGKVRGLLCINCNKGLGHFKDDEKLLDRAKKYLKL